VPEQLGHGDIDLRGLDRGIAELAKRCPRFEFWMEPGRFLVAKAGVLVAVVTQLKGKGDVQYVGIATGMNSLIRPALYGAHHDIRNLSRLEEPMSHRVKCRRPDLRDRGSAGGGSLAAADPRRRTCFSSRPAAPTAMRCHRTIICVLQRQSL